MTKKNGNTTVMNKQNEEFNKYNSENMAEDFTSDSAESESDLNNTSEDQITSFNTPPNSLSVFSPNLEPPPTTTETPSPPTTTETPSPPSTPDEKIFTEKRHDIYIALSQEPPDVDRLRQLSISKGGLLDNDLRCRAWPELLEIDVDNIPSKPDTEELTQHRDYKQVVLDVNRSAKRFPPGMEEEVRLGYQDQLIECIMWILIFNKDLHYYQGFHDVVVTFLLVVGDKLTFAIVNKLCEKHFRRFMYETMDQTNDMLCYLLPIINKENPPLKRFLEESEVGTIFCLPWIITWFGHVLNNLKDIVRLYDFFIAYHPFMPVYLAAQMVLHKSDEVMGCECEMPYVHKLLSHISDDVPFEHLITGAGDLFFQYPPSVLENEAVLQKQREIKLHKEKLKKIRSRTSPKKKIWWIFNGKKLIGMGVVLGVLSWVVYRYGDHGSFSS